MTALFTWCLRSQAINLRCPCAQLGQVCCNANARMHTSTLSFDTSTPATTESFCAIVHSLPCSFGLEAHATVRVEEDTGAVPRSVTGFIAFGRNGLSSSNGRLLINRPFAHSAKFLGHKGAGNAGRSTHPQPCVQKG